METSSFVIFSFILCMLSFSRVESNTLQKQYAAGNQKPQEIINKDKTALESMPTRDEGIVLKGSSKKHNSSFVGFTAWKKSTQFYGTGDIITFDGVIVNEGNHYNPLLSRFVCPFDGVYFISATYQAYEDNDILLWLKKEEDEIFSWNNGNYNPWNIVSQSCVVRCDQGQRIWVEARDPGAVYGESGIPHTTFTVILMYQGGITYQRHEEFIGFSVWNNVAQSYKSGERINFEQTIFNEGNHYEPNLSRFLCPFTGTYYISMNLYKTSNENMEISVAKNTLNILHMEEKSSNNFYNAVTGSRLVHCSSGEYITLQGTNNGSLFGSSSVVYSTFSGMLMHKQDALNNLHNSFAGFSVYKQTTQTYENGDTIRFDGILLNDGDHFDLLLSRFVCPVPGIYYVAVTFMKYDTEDLQIGVEKETVNILRSVETEVSNEWNTVSNSGLIRCLPGEIIIVKAVGTGAVYGDQNKALTTFSVMLMYEY